jgi:hypothetical protein
MTQIALDVQTNAPHDPLLPAAANVPSSYSVALDTVSFSKMLFVTRRLIYNVNQVRLAETFLGIAESLRKPRGFLFSSP